MKIKSMVILAAGFSIFSNSMAAAPIEVGLGTLKLNGVLQTVYGYSQTAKWSFSEKRVRLIFNGDMPEQRLKYLVQLEALVSPALLDARIQAIGWLPRTDVFMGRFLPSFSFYMPRSTATLEMISYPLLVTRYAMWRQMGLQTTTRIQPLELNLGVFNGYPANNFSDNNQGKDLLFSASAKPLGCLQVLGYYWQGGTVLRSAYDTRRDRFGGGLCLERGLGRNTSLVVRGEAALGQDKPRPSGITSKSSGFYVHMGLKPHPKLEILGRWDKFDTQRADDGTAWFAVGVNYYLSGNNAALFANYIHKEVELPGAAQNDELLFQVQVAF